ncbi:hypothetical protein [Neorhizobium galegae]|uniref:hypothetical protein n=1 Tax=Neorhizobium galegae TaxID=399 RepID=UPI001F1BA504|nr:hypothetical protein [Neorhizobium galegae]MCQ1836955.1 hypothetical protein [Neorhizobium galegae]UIK07254.1 hypothetical protein LZK81_09985 [Neorhizobium galegae]UIY30863.1 hypothetical protein LZK73_10990 [Neorhizobium galegae]
MAQKRLPEERSSREQLAPLDARISRNVADSLGMPQMCRRRACRRTGHCAADVSAAGEPACIGILQDCHRELFAVQRGMAVLCAERFSAWQGLPGAVDDEQAFVLRQGACAAVFALYDEQAARPALRGWLRRIRLPPPAPPPRSIAGAFERFGEFLPEEEDGAQ